MRGYSAATEVNGKIYLFGGFDGKEPLSLSEIYTPNLDDGSGHSWIEGIPLPSRRYGMGATHFMDNIFLVGGEGMGSELTPAYWYSTQSGEWQEVNTPPMEGLGSFGFSALGTDIYILGGRNNESPVNTNRSYKILYVTVLPIMP